MANFYHIKALSPNFENYLKTIGDIEANKGQVRSKNIAGIMGVNPSSVTNALQILKEQDLITYTPYSPIALTSGGIQNWRIIKQKYKAVRDFLIEILEIDNKTSEKLACTMEHSISSQVVERLLILKQILQEDYRYGTEVLEILHAHFEVEDDDAEKRGK